MRGRAEEETRAERLKRVAAHRTRQFRIMGYYRPQELLAAILYDMECMQRREALWRRETLRRRQRLQRLQRLQRAARTPPFFAHHN